MIPILTLVLAIQNPAVPGGVTADVTPDATMLRYPDVSRDQVCFVYANDIWVAPRAGGVAAPLASPPGPELFPRFSADGKTIAFVGHYDGTRDLYTLPVAGGLPARVTHYPGAETLADWAPDNRLLFISNAWAGLQRQSQLFTVPVAGGLPERMPVPYGGFGSISGDGRWLAYTPHSTDNRTWKRYRGGMATDIWLFDLRDRTSKKITDWEGTDTLPMWHEGFVYYLSDAGPEHRLNIWSYDPGTGARRQLTTFRDDDVKWPSMGPGPDGRGEIVFQLGSSLRLLGLADARVTDVRITIPGARPTLRARSVNASSNIANAALSPSGKRVLFEARGDVWSVPSKEGAVRNLTRSDGVAERDPAWSPDGKQVAYFSDANGEYNLCVRPVDGKTEARTLTDLGPGFRFNPVWSPDSKRVAFVDQAGRLLLTVVETGETTTLDQDPWSNQMPVSWSSDSQWLAYSRTDEDNRTGVVWIANVVSGAKQAVTDPFFNADNVAFDRKGEFLYITSNRTFSSPMYGDLDTTWIYAGTENLLAIPLRADIASPLAPKSDEEEVKKDGEKKDGDKKDGEKNDDDKKDEDQKDGDKGDDADKPRDGGAKKEGEKEQQAEPAKADDGVSGTWEGSARGGPELPPDGLPFTLTLSFKDGALSGSIASAAGSGPIANGTFDKGSGSITFTVQMATGPVTMTGTVRGEEASGTWQVGDQSGSWSARRTVIGTGDDGTEDKGGKEDGDKGASKDEPKPVTIDFDGFERRAIQIPVTTGTFGGLAVTHDHKLVYVRQPARGQGGEAGIKIYDLSADEKEEKAVTGGNGFQISADGKKLLVGGGSAWRVVDAAAGGGKTSSVVTSGMMATIDPRDEWNQIFMDSWRIMRDYFYEPTMHGTNWAGIRDHYKAMLDDCVTREDVNYVIAEMISELNVGHAYLTSPGDVEQVPQGSVGVLGCDFVLESRPEGTAYKIAKIYEGAPYDTDARGPLSQPGVKVKAGDFLLAVNGTPVDVTRDPYAAFVNTAGETVVITVSEKPVLDADARDVIVKPLASEAPLRFRAWIDRNRRYVHEKTSGRVGYVYVPNTGVDGQNELYRQFTGEQARPALIIDERWNGGGQIPTRFIELLNRPRVNYWARRDGRDWPWPPDSHAGPKCMLINGLAGSGGDAFPAYFRRAGLGKLIGARTWGGLVGISGNPAFVDGGSISAPTFGYYDLDGTWGIEGHGVDPDMPVVDDPARMVDGGDPQLDAAIEHMLAELEARPYRAPRRPASPNRAGMGIRDEDK